MEYKIIFTGQLDPEFDIQQQTIILAKITSWSKDNILQLLSAAKPALIRQTKDKDMAVKIAKVLNQNGVSTTIKKVESNQKTAVNDDSNVSQLKQQVKSLQTEVADLRAQLNSLSEFVDEYVHKTDLDDSLDGDLDKLLGLNDSDNLDIGSRPKSAKPDKQSLDIADLSDLEVDPPATFLSKVLPWIIVMAVISIGGILAWEYWLKEM
jgi:hypothetical protein